MEIAFDGVGKSAIGLDADLKRKYAAEGFVVVRSLFDAQTMKAISAVTDGLRASPESVESAWQYFDDDVRLKRGIKLIHRVERFRDAAPVFGRVLTDRALMHIVNNLLGAPGVLFKEKINFKPPGGSGFLAHQDMQAGWGRYASTFVSAFIAIDEATRENGCLEVAPRAHRGGLLGDAWAPLTSEATSNLAFRPIEMEPGDAVFFDAFTPHASAPNATLYDRRALIATYNKSSEGDHYHRYYADKFASHPPDMARRAGVEYRYRV